MAGWFQEREPKTRRRCTESQLSPHPTQPSVARSPPALNVHRIRRCAHQPASRNRQRPHRPPISITSLLCSLSFFPLSLRAREPSRPDSLARTIQNASFRHSASPSPPFLVACYLEQFISLSNSTASGGRSTLGSWPAPSRATSS